MDWHLNGYYECLNQQFTQYLYGRPPVATHTLRFQSLQSDIFLWIWKERNKKAKYFRHYPLFFFVTKYKKSPEKSNTRVKHTLISWTYIKLFPTSTTPCNDSKMYLYKRSIKMNHIKRVLNILTLVLTGIFRKRLRVVEWINLKNLNTPTPPSYAPMLANECTL